MQSFNRFLCLYSKQSGKRSQAPDVVSLGAVDGLKKKQQQCFDAENILYNLYRTDIKIFVLVSFVFSLNFSFILTYRCIKPI